MASRTFSDVQAIVKALKVLPGSFAPAGTGAVTAVQGMGFTVARTGVGVFTVALQDSWPALISATCALQLATGDDKVAQFGAIDVVTAKTVVIRVWDVSAAAVADIAADPNNRINFVLFLKNTTAQ